MHSFLLLLANFFDLPECDYLDFNFLFSKGVAVIGVGKCDCTGVCVKTVDVPDVGLDNGICIGIGMYILYDGKQRLFP